MTLIHISRVIPQETDLVKERLSQLDKYERRYLKQFSCGWCEIQLTAACCGKIPFEGDDEPCSQETRIRRINNCLMGYKPRPSRRKA